MRSIGMPNPPPVSFWLASLAFAAGFDLVGQGYLDVEKGDGALRSA